MRKPLLEQLIDALRVLPSVGPKSAQRMAFHLLTQDLDGARWLVKILDSAVQRIHLCRLCRMLTEEDPCKFCAATRRDSSMLCVVESPADVFAIESSATYSGFYFVLHGHLSPIEGVGPEQLGINLLLERLNREPLEELILATNPTVEGEVTAHYISERLDKVKIKTTRIARGVPTGRELENMDSNTLGIAISSRGNMI